SISFRNGPLGATMLAVTSVSFFLESGNRASASVTIGTGFDWYVDANPATDDEFSQKPLPEGYDLLSIIRHEVGHAVGWTGTSRVTKLVGNDVFDSSRSNIAVLA